ncbi:MAG: ferredoxin family protein [Polaromonas sp.]|nr:ferredoxin family protein [Polaromonas sp.]
MTHVVTDACIKCKYTDCVDVCPVDCFRAGPDFLVIDPDECIDCAVCIPECPVNAIYADADIPADFQPFLALNAQLSREWPTISRRTAPFPEAAQWKDKTGKLASLGTGLPSSLS